MCYNLTTEDKNLDTDNKSKAKKKIKAKKIKAKKLKGTKKKSSPIYDILIAVCVVVMVISAMLIYDDISKRVYARDEIKQLQALKPGISTIIDNEKDKESSAKSYAELKQINSDYVGWITIPDSEIDLPVVQCSNNDYYLMVSFNDEYSSAGCLFLDCDNSSLFDDQNSVIYGHAMLDGSMFGLLKRFKQQDYYEQHPFIYMMLEDRTYVYQVVSVNVVDVLYDYRSSEYYSIASFISDLSYSSYISSSANVDDNSKILTLSTCTGDDDTRLAVFAVLLNPDGVMIDTGDITL